MVKYKADIANFEKIITEYHILVFRTAIGFVHVKEDAEDLTQEIFLKAYNSWDSFRGESEISTWLYRITVNFCLNYLDKKQKRGFLQITEDVLKNIFNKESAERNPYQNLEANEQRNTIQKAIDTLPEKQRVAFVLSKYDELTQKEVATIMKTTEGAVEQLLLRAKSNLKKKLEHTIGN